MPINGEQATRNLLNEKLNTLSGVLRLGFEACQKGSLEAVAMHIVNNTRMLVRFERCCLVDFRSGKPEVLAVMGVAEVNQNSEFCVNIRKLLQPFGALKKARIVREEVLKELNAAPRAFEAFDYFRSKMEEMILIPLPCPDSRASQESGIFIWAVEFQSGIGTDEEKLLLLLSQLHSVALWYSVRRRSKAISSIFRTPRLLLTPGRILAALAVILALSLFLLKVDQSALADFQLEPPVKTVEYAPFNGMLKRASFSNGQEVKKGDTILEYDVEELKYELAASVKDYEELCAQLDLARQNSFVNPEELSKVKILEASRDRKKVEIDRANWHLARSVLKADRDGTLMIDEPDLLRGKSVTAGQTLYEIMPHGPLIAKIHLNEADASVICPEMKIALYLHSMPASAISAKALSVSPRPTMQENRQFCYVIKSELEAPPGELICGMRGVAKVSGRKALLGYYLFRNALLWWRKI